MSKKLLNLWLTLLVTFLMGSSLVLAGCAPSVIAEGQVKPTLDVTLPAYPGPTAVGNTQLTPQPKPTRADGMMDRYDGLLVTPLPDEKVSLGQVVEIPPPAAIASPRYSIRNENKNEGNTLRFLLFVRDSQTGQEIRLGSENGQALFGAMNETYVIWKQECDKCASLKTGLYAYSIKTNTNILLSDRMVSRGFPKIDGELIIYSSPQKTSDSYFGKGELHAHNLITGEDILVGDDLVYPYAPLIGSPNPSDYYAVHGDSITWIATDNTSHNWVLHVYDLKHHAIKTLNVPEILNPVFKLNVYDNFVVWWSGFWQGYDLKRDAYFTIPVIPSGWENLPVGQNGLVTAEGNTLHWSLELDGETHYFTAPIVPKGPGAQPTHIVPAPHRKPTASPTASPISPTATSPAAYP